jgi:hypothetical protein
VRFHGRRGEVELPGDLRYGPALRRCWPLVLPIH